MEKKYYFEDFTEDNYRSLIRIAKEKFIFIFYPEFDTPEVSILLRHDVDCSVHRAYRLALIEAEEGLMSTFFIWLHSPYYNCFESEIVDLVNQILMMGHKIGLHFDPLFYAKNGDISEKLLVYLEKEQHILEDLFNCEISAFSFHDPTPEIISRHPDCSYLGMVNTYSEYLRNNYEYCSDSNGYWRFNRLLDVFTHPEKSHLQILTHPEWWTPEVMSPRERISRCIEGRSRKRHAMYDATMEKIGRLNLK